MARVKEISVFVDESGSFAPLEADPESPYYLLCMVFHDQDDDISAEIDRLADSLQAIGLTRDHAIHAGPLIRREDEYENMPREQRIGIQFMPEVSPGRYRLFQVADVACTLELVAEKLRDTGKISGSEDRFFGGIKNLKKNYLKPLVRKLWV